MGGGGCGGNNAIPPSWTLLLPESWGESITDFKGEVDGFNTDEGEGEGRKKSLLTAPSPIVFSMAFIDGGRDQCTSEIPLEKRLLCRLNDYRT